MSETNEELVVENDKCGDYKKLKEFFEGLSGEKPVALFSHRSPDPDAISSMLGMVWVLNRVYGIDADIFYDGEISHPQNSAMVNLLSIDMLRACDYEAEKYEANIVLDTVPKNAGTSKNKINFDVCIDHHNKDQANGYKGIFIHNKVGSCAGIVYDIAKSLVPKDKWFQDEVDFDQKVATSLIAGIMTDTHFMLSSDCTEYELDAFVGLQKFRDENKLEQILFFRRSKFWTIRKAEGALSAKIDEEGNAIVGLGLIPEKERDIIADMADEMATWSGVSTAICFAVVNGDRVAGSVRSLNASLSVAEFCKKLGTRHGGGGGKQGKGAYNLPLAGFSIEPDEDEQEAEEAWGLIKKREMSRIHRILKK